MKTGINHNELNKVKIAHQKEYMADRPCILLVPLMTLEQTKNWHSKSGYSSLLCIGGDIGENKEKASDICKRVIQTELPTCSMEELHDATNLLACFTKWLAYSLLKGECFDGWVKPHDNEKEKLIALQKSLEEKTTVGIPVLAALPDMRVAKVTFDATSANLHDPPDPFLLAVKAAVTWSWRNGQKLLPGCSVSDEDECSECARMAEYSAHAYQEIIRPCNHLQIALGLGLHADETTVFKLD
jgi:hypothetical protein